MNYNEQQAKYQAFQQAQTGQTLGGAGLAGTAMGSYPDVPQSRPVATMSSVIETLHSQACELRQRASQLATALGGSTPEESRKDQGPSCMVDMLQIISTELQAALNEMQRAQGRL